MSILSLIKKADVLNGLEEDVLQQLAAIAYEKQMKQGERLFARGETADALYIVKRGRVALTVTLRVLDGEQETAVEEKNPLDAFGWSVLVEPRMSIYSAYCTLDGEVVVIPGDELEALMAGHRRLAHQLSQNFCELIGARARVLQELWIDEVEQSLERVKFWTGKRLHSEWSAAMRPSRRR